MAGEKTILVSARGVDRLAEATRWLRDRGAATEVVLVGRTLPSVADLARTAARDLGGSFGWHRFTLVRLAWALAETRLAAAGKVPVSTLAFEAVCARVVHTASSGGTLGRFTPIGDRPGLPRALARTFLELRAAKVHPKELGDVDLARLFDDCTEQLGRAGLVDHSELLTVATDVAREPLADRRSQPLTCHPLLLLDVPIVTTCERELVRALIGASGTVLATVVSGDEHTLMALRELGVVERESGGRGANAAGAGGRSALGRLQEGLFVESSTTAAWPSDDSVSVFSAPGESRECVEIARRVHAAAEQGVPFDRMAVVLRSPAHYRAHLLEAFRRAGIPAHFAEGTTRPDPAGRAFLSLLTCAATGLPASRFAEYLSLGEAALAMPDGAPPPVRSSAERWVPPDELVDRVEASDEADDDASEGPESELPRADPAVIAVGPAASATVRAPRLWERLLVDAAVIGGLDRWRRRLSGLGEQLEVALAELEDPDSAEGLRLLRDKEALASLATYALPLLAELDSLPSRALWGDWLEKLGGLATRALRRPERVLGILEELRPMASVGPVELREVRLVLERRLGEVAVKPSDRRYGRVFVASSEDVRGHTFDVVFLPGLAEKLFPQRVVEDPIVPDRLRRGSVLPTNRERGAGERLALRLAIGAASQRVVVSYPRLDVEQSRPRTPSFYGLEVLRAAEGSLPGFDELSRRADMAGVTGAVRVGWPAPAEPRDAIDDAEHDLSLLDAALSRPRPEAQGMARYLLSARDHNPHLERALRFREKRWRKQWTDADGLLQLPADAEPALAAHALLARTYSPTGLQHFASCPYRFVLQALHKLAPREAPAPLEELDPLQRGSLIHEVQYALYTRLRDERLLPVTPERLAAARAALEEVLDEVVERSKDELAPAILQVWEDGVAAIRADLREWLRRASEDPAWRPEYFELSFGLPPERARDVSSSVDPARLDCGIQLRGSIDLVEKDETGALRATDYKTGKARAEPGMVVGGGEVLQPVLYALALEKLRPGERVVGGSLYFCTTRGGFATVPVPLDDEARAAAAKVAGAVGDSLERGFLPAAPRKDACQYCDYLRVCGPHEEQRVKRKPGEELILLQKLRALP